VRHASIDGTSSTHAQHDEIKGVYRNTHTDVVASSPRNVHRCFIRRRPRPVAPNVPDSGGGPSLYLEPSVLSRGVRTEPHDGKGLMSLAHAIIQTMQAHDLTTAQVATRLGLEDDRATFYRMVNGATKEPRLGTIVRLCIALETTPSELLELAGVWSPDTPGRAGPDDLRLRQAFGQMSALPANGKRWAAPLVAALATALVTEGERSKDEGVPHIPAAARRTQPPTD